MIKKLINKIKSIFSKEKQVTNPVTIKEQSKNIDIFDLKHQKEENYCKNCGFELKGHESKETEDKIKYVVCKNCNYVNKIRDGIVIDCPQNMEEIRKALILFGRNEVKYSYTEFGEKHTYKL